MVKHPQQLGTFTRAALVLLRLAAAAEVFRVGYLVGSYRQGMDCTRRLVELRSPLGGEIAAIIRSRVGGRCAGLLQCAAAPAQRVASLPCNPAHACCAALPTFAPPKCARGLTVLLSLCLCCIHHLKNTIGAGPCAPAAQV